MSELVFYTNPMSRGRIVRWMLEEIGAPYQTEILAFGPALKSSAFRAINPMGKLPAIRHGATVVTECAAICAYLADAFPQAGLAPPIDARGAYYRWLFFAAGPLEAAWTNDALKVVVPPERAAMPGYGSLALVLEVLEAELAARDYVAGATFTAADVYLGAQLGFGLQFGMFANRPVLEAYVARCAARPAAVRAREIDDALVAQAQAVAS